MQDVHMASKHTHTVWKLPENVHSEMNK
jgi:hypothetical protein